MSNVTHESVDARRVAALLNGCIEVCIDGQKTYAIAAANVRNPLFKQMLQRHSDQRADFVIRLQETLTKLGLAPENEGTVRGMARRRIMETRHALEPTHSDYTVLRQCIYDEVTALQRYSAAVRAMGQLDLSVDVRVLLDEQVASIRGALEETRQRLDSH